MNQQNPNIPNGTQQQNPLNLQGDVPNANWTEEISVQERARFVSQL